MGPTVKSVSGEAGSGDHKVGLVSERVVIREGRGREGDVEVVAAVEE
jgi:hypothetical protein